MTSGPQPFIIVSRPCPRRARAIERLLAGTLGGPDREAIERHLSTCSACQGYRDWLRLEAETARELARRHTPRIMLDAVRGPLEREIASLCAAEATRALVQLAEWYIVRRESPDPRIYARSRPRPRSRSGRALQEAIERWRAAPWDAAQGLTPRIEHEARALSLPRPTNRAAARALLDLASEIDIKCYRAAWLRADLIGEAGFHERGPFERDVEILLSSPSRTEHAIALSQKATYTSVVIDDLEEALRLYSCAADTDRAHPNDRFNAWLLSLSLGDESAASDQFRDLRARIGNRPIPSKRRRAYREAVARARADGFIAPSILRKWSRRIRDLIDGDLT